MRKRLNKQSKKKYRGGVGEVKTGNILNNLPGNENNSDLMKTGDSVKSLVGNIKNAFGVVDPNYALAVADSEEKAKMRVINEVGPEKVKELCQLQPNTLKATFTAANGNKNGAFYKVTCDPKKINQGGRGLRRSKSKRRSSRRKMKRSSRK